MFIAQSEHIYSLNYIVIIGNTWKGEIVPKLKGNKVPCMLYVTSDIFNAIESTRGLIPRAAYLENIVTGAIKNE